MLPLFAWLVELNLGGMWYHEESDKKRLFPAESLWPFKNLTLDVREMALIRHCPSVEHLRVIHRRFAMTGRMHTIRNILILRLQALGNIKTIEFAMYKFKVRGRVDPYQPYELLDHRPLYRRRRYPPQKWWSTEEVAAQL
ncbi:hypothetical protein BGX33_012320 [Mortierella sp. NVP41]|nr:hypothetical protein BGX33_012320 [Mortierella sp. NVP41]